MKREDKEKSKTAAQRATAAVVQGLGDMAMVKSGLAAAAGNFGEAAAFSVIGTLAYGVAAKLAPSEKTKTTAPSLGPLKASLIATGATVTIDFGSVEMAARLGYTTQVVALTTISTNLTPYNVGGVWMPNGVAGDVRRYLTQRAAASSNEMSGLSTDVVNWGQIVDVEIMSSAFYAANVARYFAATQIYATAAGRQLADPNNTLEGMVEAAATGVPFRVYREAATAEGTTPGYYLPAKMPSVAQQGKAMDMVAALDEPRLWNTSGIFFRAST